MSHRILVLLLLMMGVTARAEVAETFEVTAPRELIIRPPASAAQNLLDAKFEPTKHELQTRDFPMAEKWEQGFLLRARLPLDEGFSLHQEIRTGLQTETVLKDALSSTYRDVLSALEKTSAEFRAGEAVRLATTIQQQWMANNRVPFAEIVTYGTELVVRPIQSVSLKLQAESKERVEFAGGVAQQQTYRLAIDEELVPKKLKATVSTAVTDVEETEGHEISEQRFDAALLWSPEANRTALTLGADLTRRESSGDSLLTGESGADLIANYHLKLRQRLFSRSQLELHAGRETHSVQSLNGAPTPDGWNLGLTSELFVCEDWNAALSARYQLRDKQQPSLAPPDEVGLTLSLRGRF